MSRPRDDDLIERIRERTLDPERRVDDRPSQFWSSLTTSSTGDLLAIGRTLSADLARLVREGPDDELSAKAEGVRQSMETPVERPLPPTATAEQVDAAEGELEVRLPPLLRRLYLEVANGGFGPGGGIVGLRGGWTTDRGSTLEDLYDEMRDATTEDPAWTWPVGLLPVLDVSGVFVCTDASSPDGRIVEFDFEELDDDGHDRGWSRAFSERSPSLAAWLEEWLAAAPAHQQMAAELTEAMQTIPEVTRAHWAAMTPDERATYGLPEKGWGRSLFGDAWGDDPRDQ